MKRTLRRILMLITVLAVLLPTGGLASGLFDGLLPTEEPTVEPTPAPTVAPTAEPTAAQSAEPNAPTGERVERHEDVSLNEAAAIILTQDETKLLRVEYDVTTRVLVLYFADDSVPLPEATPIATTPASSAGLDDSICPYCFGLGDCSRCVFGECDNCFGDGSVFCSRCGGTGSCSRCYGTGGEMKLVGGDLRWYDCTSCRGSGQCGTCKGAGTQQCSRCHGSGNCNYCHGTDKCQYCGGTGRR